MSSIVPRRIVLPATILLLGFTAAGAGILSARPDVDPEWGRREAVAVVTARSTRRPLVLQGVGTLRSRPGAARRVNAPVAGRVAGILVARGQWVAAGDPLAWIIPPPAPTPSSHVSKPDPHDAAVDARTSAPPIVTGMLTPTSTESVPLRAPAAGVVHTLLISEGQELRAGEVAAEVIDLGQLLVAVRLPAPYHADYRPGMPVVVTCASASGELFRGEVRATPSAPAPDEELVSVEVAVSNRQGFLLDELPVQAYVRVRPRQPERWLPPSCFIERRGEPSVFVVTASGRIEARHVTIGQESLGMVRVLSGLADGEQVVTDGSLPLMNDQPVRVLPMEQDLAGEEER
jgi:multidrug efflux pump subunit AcrA (membrane-fusion protein)